MKTNLTDEQIAEREKNREAQAILDEIAEACNLILPKIEKKIRDKAGYSSEDGIETVLHELKHKSHLNRSERSALDLGKKREAIENLSKLCHGFDAPSVKLANLFAKYNEPQDGLGKTIKKESKAKLALKAVGNFITKPIPKVGNYLSVRFFAATPQRDLGKRVDSCLSYAQKNNLLDTSKKIGDWAKNDAEIQQKAAGRSYR